MAVDQKVIEEKVSGKNKEPLTAEEQTTILQEEGAVEGYQKGPEAMDPAEFDQTPETKEGDEPAKKEEPAAKEEKKDDAPDEAEDVFVRLERELAKPEGQEDLKNFNDREKAYFHQMKRDRKKRQDAEALADAARKNELLAKKQLEESKKPKEEAPDPLADLKKKDATDYMTVADVIKLVEGMQTKPKEEKKEDIEVPSAPDPKTVHYLKLCEKEGREAHEDFDAVLELTEDVILSNPKHLMEVAKATQAGVNPAIKAYELIKADPEFAKLYPVATARIAARKSQNKTPEPAKKEEPKKEAPAKTQAELDAATRAKKAEEALETNAKKPKTTGNASASSESNDEINFEEMAKMPDAEFKKLPKKKRDRFLKWLEEV